MKKNESLLNYMRGRIDYISDKILNEMYEIKVIDSSATHGANHKFFATSADHVYRQVSIYIYPGAKKLLEDKEFKRIDNMLVHEIVHIQLSRLSELAEYRFASKEEMNNATEETTQSVAMSFSRLLFT